MLFFAASCQKPATSVLAQYASEKAPLVDVAEDVTFADVTPTLYAKVLKDAVQEVDKEIANGIEVPIPKDMAGGYTCLLYTSDAADE